MTYQEILKELHRIKIKLVEELEHIQLIDVVDCESNYRKLELELRLLALKYERQLKDRKN